VPAEWLVTVFFGLVHAADEHMRAHDLERDEALALAAATIGEVFAGRSSGAA
jgi:hypothetical protein